MDSPNGLRNGKSISPDAMAISTPSANGNANSAPDAMNVKLEPSGDMKVPASASASASPAAFTSATSDQFNPEAHPKMKASPSDEETVGGDILLKQEPGQPPKLSRSSSQKVVSRPPQLFDHLPDSTQDALATFEQIQACWYANKYMGYTEHAMECDCSEERDAKHGQNQACGDDSDCINRATKIECVGDCGCGADCRNQRFQNKEYAQVSVIKTEKKGFGLRAETKLEPHQLIFEYVGEVVGEAQFRRRMRQYDEEGIKHFYFMSLNKGEFVDATKRGNLGRFCNHSCNPNCYVDKWVVGEKLRMGIFAERVVEAGEELVFNYNVDRYGADPQPCYCAEPNCTGFIGGRTQTEQATKLSNATIEALGIDEEDAWDTVVARRPKKKKTEENDEEYVDSVQPKSLQEDGVTKVMAALMQCQEKWIAVKLLGRIQRCEDERVSNRVVKMHGYQILNSQLAQWKEDHNVVLQILDILDKFPRMTRNKIIDSKIETNIQPLTTCGDERVEQKAIVLLADWADLKVGYRIPRMKRDEQAKKAVNQFERRESGREQRQRSVTRSPSPSYEARQRPTQPRRERIQHQQNQRPRPNRRRQLPDRQLPDGWFQAEDESGRFYYYTADGKPTWQKPTAPATPAAPTAQKKNLALQSIIDGIVNSQEKTPTSEHKIDTPDTPQPASDHQEKKREDKGWRKLSIEKQKKLYENTVRLITPTSPAMANQLSQLFPHIKPFVDKYKNKIPKDDLKRFAKETATKLVNSDYKANRVTDPTKISDKHQQKVKSFCKDYFDKAYKKHKERMERRSKSSSSSAANTTASTTTTTLPIQHKETEADSTPADADEDVTKLSDDEAGGDGDGTTSTSPMDDDASASASASLKRKRPEEIDAENLLNGSSADAGSASPSKRQKSTPPPPPPPPPDADADADADLGDETPKLDDEDDESAPPPPPPPPPKDEHSKSPDEYPVEMEGVQQQQQQNGVQVQGI
ncbi:hypothetical protein N7509_001177 [Penicillium cosmopolitanum]|uniref:Histone-lysine N-methyltransferase, H3 lysine-36 specific n=1 Tax=Penicillium cosmopolitanum TaxID=1131564 RepID=A0A9W9WBM6_9EURO|nr:uncharacterized protein N7509_001177 [Penicillium cosmopolitanum]KAJ5414550.1 hypothetical protein N7509_001177 [Penicillium cosmopolitanum]